jgi:hypothetical protein
MATMQSIPHVYLNRVKKFFLNGKLTRRKTILAPTEANLEAKVPMNMGRGVLNATISGRNFRRVAISLMSEVNPTSFRMDMGCVTIPTSTARV